MAYTPPTKDSIDFVLTTGYTPPTKDSIDFVMGEGEGPISVTPPAFEVVGTLVATPAYSPPIIVSPPAFEVVGTLVATLAIDIEITPPAFEVVGTLLATIVMDIEISPPAFEVVGTLEAIVFHDTGTIIVIPPAFEVVGTIDVLRIGVPQQITAKSITFDIADGWEDSTYLAVRSIDFWFEGSKITNLATTDFVAYATTNFDGNYIPSNAFDTSLDKLGSPVGEEWYSEQTFPPEDQRLICVFNEEITFDEIRINNAHNSGNDTDRGIKTTKIHISSQSITSTVYDEAIPDSHLIFDGVISEHTDSNVEDEERLNLLPLPPIVSPPAFEVVGTLETGVIAIVELNISSHSNHYKFQRQLGLIDLTSDNLLAVLVNASFVFDKDSSAILADISPYESLGSSHVPLVFTSQIINETKDLSRVTFEDIVLAASGANIEPSSGLIVYDSDTPDDTIVGFVSFFSLKEILDLETLLVNNIYFDDI